MPNTFFSRWWQSQFIYSLKQQKLALVASLVFILCLISALGARWIAPFNPYLANEISLDNGLLPPAWLEGANPSYLLGTDDQGRDIFSAILYGTQISLIVSISSVILSLVIGSLLGLISGYIGGILDVFIMRMCDVMLSFPAILLALLVAGIGRALFPTADSSLALTVLIVSIALSSWVQYARTVRGSTLIEKNKEYILAAKLIGVNPLYIMISHILPNVLTPVMVLASVQVATAIIIEATLSFLGVGMPPTTPSLGTLIRTGNDFLFSGEWWIAIFPGLMLVILSVSVNLVGDWLRDYFNPRLR
ncbi:MAG: ABC transporter permease [Gammaproteobacteria bacterium]|nr:ABC transporter permease [Gammaproteobacteria bacterium]